MKLLKSILRAPIRKSILIVGASLASYVLFSLISFYLLRAMCESLNVNESCRGTNLQMLSSQVVGDFQLLARIVLELSVVVLISQLVYRAVLALKK